VEANKRLTAEKQVIQTASLVAQHSGGIIYCALDAQFAVEKEIIPDVEGQPGWVKRL
jgi:hypothetical protein